MDISIYPGYFFAEKRTFSVGELQNMATQCGDMNFIHHDLEKAKSTRFGNIIASGSAISGYFSALIPTHFSKICPMLGLEMSFRFPAPIFPNTELNMRWQVEQTKTSSETSLLVSLAGSIIDANNILTVSAKADILLLEQL